jgi:hypothetical protein
MGIMPKNLLVYRDIIADGLYNATRWGGSGLRSLPAYIRQALRDEVWKERMIRVTRQEFPGFRNFEEFVVSKPPKGLGSSIDLIARMLKDDKESLDLLDKLLQRQKGRPKPETLYNIQGSPVKAPTGTSQAAALRRLRAQRPDLHQRVLKNELSPHAAMVEAGFRARMVSIPIDPERAAAVLIKHFNRTQLVKISKLITGQD